MASNREVDFVRHVLNRMPGVQLYAKNVSKEGDALIYEFKRGTATNKATRLEIRPNPHGRVHATFLKGKSGEMTQISDHPDVHFDSLARLLFDEAGLLTSGCDISEREGRVKTTRW